LGRALTTAVSTYNQTVGSLEGRVLVSARRLNELGVVDAELATPAPVEQTTRALSAPEFASTEFASTEFASTEFAGPEPAEIEPDGNGAAQNGAVAIDHRVSLVRAAR
jgi:DNA recombination protein RmuC